MTSTSVTSAGGLSRFRYVEDQHRAALAAPGIIDNQFINPERIRVTSDAQHISSHAGSEKAKMYRHFGIIMPGISCFLPARLAYAAS